MPAYDFLCKNCGMVEIKKAMTDPNPTICPRCKTKGLQRRFVSISKIINGDHYVTGTKRQPRYGKTGFAGGAEVTPRS